MYTRVVLYKDEQNFGNTVVIYKSSLNYLVIIKDKEEISYYFLDNDMKKMYPMNTYMKQIGFEYTFDNLNDQINTSFDIDLSLYGNSSCPEYLKNIIGESLCTEKKFTKKETFFEIIKELSIIPLSLVLLVLTLAVTVIFPKEFLNELSFEETVFVGIVIILLVLYLVAGIVAIIRKIVVKNKEKNEE